MIEIPLIIQSINEILIQNDPLETLNNHPGWYNRYLYTYIDESTEIGERIDKTQNSIIDKKFVPKIIQDVFQEYNGVEISKEDLKNISSEIYDILNIYNSGIIYNSFVKESEKLELEFS